MYTTHYPLTEDERTSFDLVIGNNQVDWDDLSARRQDAVNGLIRKYPDLEKTAVWTGSDSAASTGVPLSQMSQLPDTLSEVSTNKAWEAYNKTRGSWEDFGKSRDQQQGYPEPQTPSPTLQRRTVPPSLSMRSRPTSSPPELPLPGPPPVTRRAQHPSPIGPPDMAGLHISPADRRPIESTPPPAWRRRHPSSARSPSPGYPPLGPDPGPSRAMTQKRAWLLEQHEASRQRFTAALHAAVNAEGDMAKYKVQLQQLGVAFHDGDDEDEEEEDEGLEGQLLETAQKPAAPKSNAKKRRERKKRLSEGRMAKET